MLGGVGLGPEQAEHVVGGLRFAGPDLVTVDPPAVAVQNRAARQRREIAPRSRLAVPLTPAKVTAKRRGNEAKPLLFAAAVEQSRGEHGGPDTPDVARRAGGAELLIENHVLERIRRLLGAPVEARKAPVNVAARERALAEELLLPLRRKLRVGAAQRPVLAQEGANLAAERLVLLSQAKIHCPPTSPRGARCARGEARGFPGTPGRTSGV